jgi:hypothetical protein
MSTKHASLVLAASLAAAVGCQDSTVAPAASELSPSFAAGGAVVTQTVAITGIGGSVDLSGSATLTRNAGGVWLQGSSPELVDGHAYTVWAATFDNPSGCVDGCGGDDLGRPGAQATVSNFGGFVADASGDFELHLDRHDGSRQTLAGLGRSGVDNPMRAEIHIIFRSHGEAETDAADLAQQTSQVAAFCNLPVLGCDDHGLAIFLPPGAPGQG